MVTKSYLNQVRKLEKIPDFVYTTFELMKYNNRVSDLKKRGAIKLFEIGKDFEKISWDVYKRRTEPDPGSIWVVTNIKNANGEEEPWLVVYTDGDNDRIVRQIKSSLKKEKNPSMKKIADRSRAEFFQIPEDYNPEPEIGEDPYEPGWYYWYVQPGTLPDSDPFGPFKSEEEAIKDWEEEEAEFEAQLGEEKEDQLELFSKRQKKSYIKLSYSKGTVVQINIPPGDLYEKYNGKIGEVVSASPDRSKVSFKDMPSMVFEDSKLKSVASCPVCNSNIYLQMLKKVGKVECKCGALYNIKQLEKNAKVTAINKKAKKKMGQYISKEWEENIRQEVLEQKDAFEKRIDLGEDRLELGREAILNAFEQRASKGEMSSFGLIRAKEIVNEVFGIKLSSIKRVSLRPDVKTLSDQELWKLVQTPIEEAMSQEVIDYLKEAEEEFKNRDIKLKDIPELPSWYPKRENKKAQNVIQTLWVDDPKDLRHYFKSLQAPPVSPAGESLEKNIKPETEESETDEEVEKEASRKIHAKVFRYKCNKCGRTFETDEEVSNCLYSDCEAPSEYLEKTKVKKEEPITEETVKEEETEKEATLDKKLKTVAVSQEVKNIVYYEVLRLTGDQYRLSDLEIDEITEIMQYLPLYKMTPKYISDFLTAWLESKKIKVIASIKKRKKKIAFKSKEEEVYTSILEDGLETAIIYYGQEAVDKALEWVEYGEKKKASIKKEGDATEVLRGGGGGSSDSLEPMGWNIKETKTPRLPQRTEEGEPEIEETEAIHVVVNPDTREVNVKFEDENGEETEEISKEEKAESEEISTEEPEIEPVEEEEEGGVSGENVPVNF